MRQTQRKRKLSRGPQASARKEEEERALSIAVPEHGDSRGSPRSGGVEWNTQQRAPVGRMEVLRDPRDGGLRLWECFWGLPTSGGAST